MTLHCPALRVTAQADVAVVRFDRRMQRDRLPRAIVRVRFGPVRIVTGVKTPGPIEYGDTRADIHCLRIHLGRG